MAKLQVIDNAPELSEAELLQVMGGAVSRNPAPRAVTVTAVANSSRSIASALGGVVGGSAMGGLGSAWGSAMEGNPGGAIGHAAPGSIGGAMGSTVGHAQPATGHEVSGGIGGAVGGIGHA